MTGFSRVLLAAAQNVVPASGWFLGGWSAGTALVVYWIENLVLALVIGVRIDVHRRLTHVHGHTGGFLKTFLVTSIAFTSVHGVFIVLMATLLHLGGVDWDAVRNGARGVVLSHAISLGVDVLSIGRWPFAELRRRTEWAIGRIGVVHFAILIGMGMAAVGGDNTVVFSAFVVFKVVSEIGGMLPQWRPREPPAFLVALLDRVPSRSREQGSFASYWRRSVRAEEERQARDEAGRN